MWMCDYVWIFSISQEKIRDYFFFYIYISHNETTIEGLSKKARKKVQSLWWLSNFLLYVYTDTDVRYVTSLDVH